MAARTFQLTLSAHPGTGQPEPKIPFYDSAGTKTTQEVAELFKGSSLVSEGGYVAVPQPPGGGSGAGEGDVVYVKANSVLMVAGPA